MATEDPDEYPLLDDEFLAWVEQQARTALVNQLAAARAAKQGTTMDWIDWTKV